jgi:hypothetical protein
MKIIRAQKTSSKNSEERKKAPQILMGAWSKEEKKKY